MTDQGTTRRFTEADFDQGLHDLYDYYAHGKISKREFLDRAGKAVGGLTAAAVLGTLTPNYALGQQIAEDDPDIEGQEITYHSPGRNGRDQRVSRTSDGDGHRLFACRHFGRLREKWPQSVYSRRGPAPCQGGLCCEGAGRIVVTGRLSRQ